MSTTTRPEAAPKPSAKSIYEQRKRYSTVVMADVSQYPVNHLVTFCLGEEDGVHTVEEASRKLAVMDNQGRVWTQEMLLRVSPEHVTLLDPNSKEELEAFPLGAIVRCDAVTLPGRSRPLLLLVCQEPERAQPDVHFFQGLRLGAELIREDIRGALHNHRSGRGELRAAALRATQEELQRPSAAVQTPPLQRRPSVRAVISTAERGAGRGRPQAEPIPEAEEARGSGPEGASNSADPTSPDLGPRGPDLASLQAERDVDILNHVFDDVESFVSRLQKSAEATRVLEHRERGRRTRRRAAGEGLLTLRAKPPSEAEYTDVLQKIKYAFSLLARLRGNIADPSSPELLHFLFGPLQMIVDTSGGPEFASGVRRPHLTSEAVALLRDNVTPRENALWTSLGDSWTRPGLELPAEEGPPYSPEFYSGWEPPATYPQGRAWEDPVEKQLQHERRRQQQSAPQVAVNGHQDSEPGGELQLEPDSAGKWVLCNYDFQARNSSELSVKQQDVLEVLDDRRKWWKVRNQHEQEGYVPYNILTPHPGPRGIRSQSPTANLDSADPPPPPPAPAPAPARPHWDSCDSFHNPSEKGEWVGSRPGLRFPGMKPEAQKEQMDSLLPSTSGIPDPRAPEPLALSPPAPSRLPARRKILPDAQSQRGAAGAPGPGPLGRQPRSRGAPRPRAAAQPALGRLGGARLAAGQGLRPGHGGGAGSADRRADLLAAEGGVTVREPRRGGAGVQPDRGAARAAAGLGAGVGAEGGDGEAEEEGGGRNGDRGHLTLPGPSAKSLEAAISPRPRGRWTPPTPPPGNIDPWRLARSALVPSTRRANWPDPTGGHLSPCSPTGTWRRDNGRERLRAPPGSRCMVGQCPVYKQPLLNGRCQLLSPAGHRGPKTLPSPQPPGEEVI
ncbi:epidermal growth factor receptor kinase substrate 8-like protein 1 isoform X2 [Choloepus didactylus]|uniref:epidermal growth factor receptor kinase substrate 8-like protein 1 isoform X2 n=1 Tax=Choloepus didactylus TaxID=27675 RepID=UPI00189F1DBA|nr:epidermal growth factor receptor kinase substrate 8-like protein 1 isoform X2 [Choloepus didactylus]